MRKIITLIGIFFLLAGAEGYSQTKDLSGYKISGSGFLENKGQVVDQDYKPNPDVKYLLCQPGFNVQLRKTGFSYDTYIVTRDSTKKGKRAFGRLDKFQHFGNSIYHFHRVDVELVGCNTNAEITAEEKSSTYFNYFTPGTPERGVSDVHYYQKIVYKNIYPHIDLAFFATSRGLKRPAEYEFIIHPGGNPDDIKLEYKGANRVSLADNKLVVHIASRDLTESIPSSYVTGTNQPVQVDYTALDSNTYSFSIQHSTFNIQHLSSDLVIDPVPDLDWGTYYGGPDTNGGTTGMSIALDSDNNVYITGITNSFSGIATQGAYLTNQAIDSFNFSFVAKFNSTGSSLIWGTYYGGEYAEAFGIALDPHDNVYITGNVRRGTGTISTPGSYQPHYGGGSSDAFVAKFNLTGTTLLWGSYFGGPDTDYAYGIKVDTAGNAYITGYTNSSSGIATPGAYQTTLGGQEDAFVAKFNSTGSSLLWATYYGGPESTGGGGIALDASKNVYITGGTTSTSGIATPGSYQTVFGGNSQNGDAFVAKFNATGSSLLWGTYYGGSGTGGVSIVLDASDNMYITGSTTSLSGIATPGAYQIFYGGGVADAFVAKFNATGSSLLWGTYYGGNLEDFGSGIAVDACGNSYITGLTYSSSGIATPGAYQTTFPGDYSSAFIAKFNTTGSSLLWGTYYAGGGRKGSNGSKNLDGGWGYAIALDAQANVYVTGVTDTVAGVTTPSAYLTDYPNPAGNGFEGFVAKFDSVAPQFTIEPSNTSICLGRSIGMNASGGTSYNWFPATGLSCTTCPNPIATPTTTTTYTLATNSNGCADSAHITINVITPPTVTVDTPPVSCPGSPIMLAAKGSGTGAITYQWSPGGQTTDTVTVYPTSTTIFIVSVSNGCTTYKADTVKPDNPSLIACCNKTIILGDDTVITASGNYIVKYKWEPDTGLSCDTCPTITVTPTVTTTYTVIGIDTMGCEAERLVTIDVEIPCSNISIPNVFTPNYAGPYGINNVFYINTRDVDSWSIQIYDRWGKEMFHSANPTQYWNGDSENGDKAPDGVYYYILNFNCQGTSFKKNGFLQVIR